ncbi:unnamed protein product, partial [Heterosigma akashiwo]
MNMPTAKSLLPKFRGKVKSQRNARKDDERILEGAEKIRRQREAANRGRSNFDSSSDDEEVGTSEEEEE